MYQDAKGLWRQSVTINGKRKVFSAKTKKDLMLKLAMYQNQVTYHTPSFESVADQWQNYKYDRVSYGTQRCYDAPFRDILARFGDKEIGSITSHDVQKYLNDLDMSFKSAMTRKSIISQVFDFAIVELEMSLRNPCDRVKVDAKMRRGHRQALTVEEINEIKRTEKGEFLLAPLILYTGCRCGEALALTFGDIDRKNRLIRINKSIDHRGNRPVISTTKTEAGNRVVPLLSDLERLLPKKSPTTDYIVSGPEPLTKSALRCRWKKWKEDHHVECDRHQIRHTYATILYEHGIDPKTAQLILGHANFSTTMDIYTHLSQDHIREALEKLESGVQ